MERRSFGGSVVHTGSWNRKAADLDNVAHADDEEHDPELEALYDVRAGQLEEAVFFEALEDGAFDFDKLIGQEKSEESVGVGVDGDVEGDDLIV